MSKSLEAALVNAFKAELEEAKKTYNVEDALEQALEDTTPAQPGRPWNKKKKEEDPESEWIYLAQMGGRRNE